MTDSNSDNNKTGHRKSIRVHGKLVTRTFTRKADAEKWYAERKREKELIDRGLRNETPEITFSRYLDEWLTRRKATGKPLSSWMTDEQRLRGHVKPLVGDRLLTRVTTREWEALLDQLVSGKDLSTGTRNRVRATLHKLYNDARRQGYVEVNPITAVPRLEEARNKWDYFHHHDEVEKYLRSSVEEGPNFRLFAMLALNTGLRTGEMLALSLGDVDFTHRRLRIWRTYEQCSRTIQERVKGGQH
ncbi:MAG: tyrosine-type recombinase/integrase, partial [Bdellovibrionales bacterium]|nr:tyrosine-type recombinase/integrase [Bdellovibrionales bacterium]